MNTIGTSLSNNNYHVTTASDSCQLSEVPREFLMAEESVVYERFDDTYFEELEKYYEMIDKHAA